MDCQPTRGSYPCPNGMLCKDTLARSIGPGVVRKLREALWSPRDAKPSELTSQKRRERFRETLESLLVVREDGTSVQFKLNGKPVCKHYYKVSIFSALVCVRCLMR